MHQIAALAGGRQQALLGKYRQGLAHRSPGDAQTFGNRYFGDALARRQLAAEDQFPQFQNNLFAQLQLGRLAICHLFALLKDQLAGDYPARTLQALWIQY